MSGRRKRAGLFSGFWTDLEGNKIRRIYRSEWPELYRLHRLCSETEASAPDIASAKRWLRCPSGTFLIQFPGKPIYYPALTEAGARVPKNRGADESSGLARPVSVSAEVAV